MEHFKDNSGCSGPKKSEIFWNNSRKVQYVFAGEDENVKRFPQQRRRQQQQRR